MHLPERLKLPSKEQLVSVLSLLVPPLFLVLVAGMIALAILSLVSNLPSNFSLSAIPTGLVDIVIIVIGALLLVLFGGYRLNWTWTGFGFYTIPKRENYEVRLPKTLWEWMQLIIIPAVLASAAYSFTAWNSSTQSMIAEDNNREAALQNYLDKMAGYLENRGKEDAPNEADLHKVVRTKTLTMLRRLDVNRSKIVVQFLRDSQLISTTTALVDLHDVDLSKVDMHGNDLHNVGLSSADLHGANLRGTILRSAILRSADLSDADLQGANLLSADLSYASLRGAHLGAADLSFADLQGGDLLSAGLQGANLRGANLRAADLRNADLRASDLRDANLRSADLRGAVLVAANLGGADLSDADLRDADLSRAILNGAILRGADLRNAKITREQIESSGTPIW